MTRPRYDDGGTPFTNWLRKQTILDSKLGFVATDVDLVWYDYAHAMIMLLEEKQYLGMMTPAQASVESILHQALLFALNHSDFTLQSQGWPPIPPKLTYCGYHLIQFENTSPEDGEIYIDGLKVTKAQLIQFLQFKWTPTIQCYRQQQERIREIHTQPDLEKFVQDIKQSVQVSHPETRLLLRSWNNRKKEIDEMETLFSMFPDDDDSVTTCDEIMAETDEILALRDLEALISEADSA